MRIRRILLVGTLVLLLAVYAVFGGTWFDKFAMVAPLLGGLAKVMIGVVGLAALAALAHRLIGRSEKEDE